MMNAMHAKLMTILVAAAGTATASFADAEIVTRHETAMELRPRYDVYQVADRACGSLEYTNGVLSVSGRKGGLKIQLACAYPGSRPFLAPQRIVLRTKRAVAGTVELSIRRLDRKKDEKRAMPWTDETVFDFGSTSGYWQFKNLIFTPEKAASDYEFEILSLTAESKTEPARAFAFDVETGTAIHTTTDIWRRSVVYTFYNLSDVRLRAKGRVLAESYYGDRIETAFDGLVDGGGMLQVPVDFAAKTGPKGRFHGIWTARAVLDSPNIPVTNVTRFAVLNDNPKTPRLSPDKFKMGICYHENFYSDGDRQICLEALNACGAKLVRSGGFSADDCWHEKDRLDFSKADIYMQELRDAGISINASLAGWPEWMVDPKKVRPKHWPPWFFMRPKSGILGEYAEKLARRYGGDIEMLEVGNEWDIAAPDHTITIDEAVDLQKEVYSAIRGVTKEITVLPCSWAQADSSNPLVHARRKGFQEQVMARAKGFYDAHPTHQYAEQSQFEKDMLYKFFEWRSKAGIDVPWYAAETSICPCVGVDDAQARNVWMKILWSWAHGSISYIWYNLRCTGWRTEDNEESYGILDASFHPKIPFAAFSALAHTVSGLDFDRILFEKKGRHLYGFKGGRQGRPVFVIAGWDRHSSGPVKIRVKANAERATMVNLMGDSHAAETFKGGAVFEIGEKPGALVLTGTTAVEPNRDDLFQIAEPEVRVLEARADINNRPPDFHLFNWWMVHEYWAGNPLTQHRMWKGSDDLSPAVWIGRTGGDLHVRFKVRDDIHCARMKPEYLWLSDGLQFILESPDQRGNYEIGFAMTNEGHPVVHLWSVPAGFDIERVKNAIKLKTWRDNDIQTWYDAQIPLSAIGFTDKILSEGFRFNAIFYDDDGDGDEKDMWSLRDTHMEIAPGITTDKEYSSSPIVKIR